MKGILLEEVLTRNQAMETSIALGLMKLFSWRRIPTISTDLKGMRFLGGQTKMNQSKRAV